MNARNIFAQRFKELHFCEEKFAMKELICILAALFAAAGAIITQPLTCTHPDICAPRGKSRHTIGHVYTLDMVMFPYLK